MLEQRHIEDSIKFKRTVDEYNRALFKIAKQRDSISFIHETTTKSLIDIIKQDRAIIAKYEASKKPAKDASGQTVVPNEFIDDCKNCFTQLSATADTIEKFKSESAALEQLHVAQMQADSMHISELEAQKLSINKDYNNMGMAAAAWAKAAEPRRKIKIGIGAILNNKFLPNAVGPAFMYQDKKDRNIEYQPMFGNGEPMHVITVLVPFNWRR